jgi:hypothetical protein
VFGVHLDGLDDQVQFVRTVDLSRHAVVLAWRDLLGFGEVIQAVDPAGRVVLHEEHDTGSRFCPREQEQIIGAEFETLPHKLKNPMEESSRLFTDSGRISQAKSLETHLEFVLRPGQRGSLVDHWCWPKPARMAPFFTGTNTVRADTEEREDLSCFRPWASHEARA